MHTAVTPSTLPLRLDRGRGALRTGVVVFGVWQCLLVVLTLALGGEAGATTVLQALANLAGGLPHHPSRRRRLVNRPRR